MFFLISFFSVTHHMSMTPWSTRSTITQWPHNIHNGNNDHDKGRGLVLEMHRTCFFFLYFLDIFTDIYLLHLQDLPALTYQPSARLQQPAMTATSTTSIRDDVAMSHRTRQTTASSSTTAGIRGETRAGSRRCWCDDNENGPKWCLVSFGPYVSVIFFFLRIFYVY